MLEWNKIAKSRCARLVALLVKVCAPYASYCSFFLSKNISGFFFHLQFVGCYITLVVENDLT